MTTHPHSVIRQTNRCTSCQQAMSVVEGSTSRPQDLVRLLCTLQSTLFFWCREQLDKKEKEGEEEEREKEKECVLELLLECELKQYPVCTHACTWIATCTVGMYITCMVRVNCYHGNSLSTPTQMSVPWLTVVSLCSPN